jgi:hypothetical protein
LLSQLNDACLAGKGVGSGTENGIWLFFDRAIKTKEHYDNIFIYSDMQAGHGGLYGTNPDDYKEFGHSGTVQYRENGYGDRFIDVLRLVEKYRQVVNSKVNVFSVQVAGYDNSVVPENIYRGAILAGWTGKEPIYAKAIIDTWNQIEKG